MPTTLKKPPSVFATRFCPPLLLYRMMHRPLEFLSNVADKHEIAQLGWIGAPLYLVNEPELVKQMLMDTRRFHKGSIFKRLEMVLGKGLITLDGPQWLDARRRMQQAFRQGLLIEQQQIVIRHTVEVINRLQDEADRGPIDLHPISSELMLRIALELLFGASPDSIDLDQARTDVEICNDYVKHRVWAVTPQSWARRRFAAFQGALGRLKSIVDRIIEQRRGEVASRRQQRCDVLSLLFEAGFEGNDLRDHVMTMLIAGHETTATAVSFVFALLARHAGVQQRLYEEVRDFSPQTVPLDATPFTHAVLNETLRLYPVVPLLDRAAVEEASLGEYRIPKGANLIWAPYCVHRKHWPSPETFNPDRFLDADRIPKHAFIPFGEGPRVCIGKPLAEMEGVTIAALFARAFELTTEERDLQVHPLITLQPKNGVVVRLHPRSRPNDEASLDPAADSGILAGVQ
jgi:cytochrome P450